jgi:hypothetical protein
MSSVKILILDTLMLYKTTGWAVFMALKNLKQRSLMVSRDKCALFYRILCDRARLL